MSIALTAEQKQTRSVTLKAYASGIYDLQDLRLRMGGRVVAAFKDRLGQKPGQKEADGLGKGAIIKDRNDMTSEELAEAAAEAEKEANEILSKVRKEYARMTDGLASSPSRKKLEELFRNSNIIHTEQEFLLVKGYLAILEEEEAAFNRAPVYLQEFPIYAWLRDEVKGIGPALSCCLLSKLDIHKARHPSSFWKYCGLDVTTAFEIETTDKKGKVTKKYERDDKNGGREISVGRRNWKILAQPREYEDKDGDKAVRLDLGYNPWLKAKLCQVAADCMIKAGKRTEKMIALNKKGEPIIDKKTGEPKLVKNPDGETRYIGPYAKIYDDYKHRILTDPRHADKKPVHVEKMARRYMIKQFLLHLHMKWSEMEGLPVSVSYHEAKQGHVHGVTR
jgi:hypothetical protein